MNAGEPGLQVREDEMNDGQKVFGDLWIASLCDGVVIVAALPQAGVAAPLIRNRERSLCHGVLDKPAKRLGAPVGRDSEPKALSEQFFGTSLAVVASGHE